MQTSLPLMNNCDDMYLHFQPWQESWCWTKFFTLLLLSSSSRFQSVVNRKSISIESEWMEKIWCFICWTLERVPFNPIRTYGWHKLSFDRTPVIFFALSLSPLPLRSRADQILFFSRILNVSEARYPLLAEWNVLSNLFSFSIVWVNIGIVTSDLEEPVLLSLSSNSAHSLFGGSHLSSNDAFYFGTTTSYISVLMCAIPTLCAESTPYADNAHAVNTV